MHITYSIPQRLIVYALLMSFVIQSCNPLNGTFNNKLEELQPEVEAPTDFLGTNNSCSCKNVEVEDKVGRELNFVDDSIPDLGHGNRKDEEGSNERKLAARKFDKLKRPPTSNVKDENEELPDFLDASIVCLYRGNKEDEEKSNERKMIARRHGRFNPLLTTPRQ